MSDRPTDMKIPELKDLVIAVRDLIEWHDLGLQLGLPEATLRLIALHPDVRGHLRMMFSEWLQYDPGASWEKLAAALNRIGKNAIAANIRIKSMGVEAQSMAVEPEAKKRKSELAGVDQIIPSHIAIPKLLQYY